MRNFKVLLTIALIASISFLGYYYIFREIPPLERFRTESGIDLPDDLEVLHNDEQWNEFNGDGYREIVLKLNDEAIRIIEGECPVKGYKKLPIEKWMSTKYIRPAEEGYYRERYLSEDKQDFVIIVFDLTQSKAFYALFIQ